MKLIIVGFGIWLGLATAHAFGADVTRRIVAEIDPVAPVSAEYEQQSYDVKTSKFGAAVDFNMGAIISTGPELWTGNFTVQGPSSSSERVRREDFQYGERHKLDATRIQWNFTKWEQAQSMRGWFVKAGYSYTRINSRANRISETLAIQDPDNETDLVTDIRHGAVLGFGNRWGFMKQRLTVNLGASITANFRRGVSVDSSDPDARADYDDIIEDLPETRMSVRPMPEAQLRLGYAW